MDFQMKLFRPEKIVYEHRGPGLVLQVVERGERLEMRFGNHIVQSAHSLISPDILQLDYTRAMMAGFLMHPQPDRILHIGLGGGSIPRFIHKFMPEVRQRVVELSPEVVAACRRYFDLPESDRLEVRVAEGAAFLATDTDHYDMVFLDAFMADGPANEVVTAEFFRLVHQRLRPGGWLINNVWGSDRERLHQVRADMVRLFDHQASISVRVDSNVIIMGSQAGRMPTTAQLRRRAILLSRRFPLDFHGMLGQIRVRGPAAGSPAGQPGRFG